MTLTMIHIPKARHSPSPTTLSDTADPRGNPRRYLPAPVDHDACTGAESDASALDDITGEIEAEAETIDVEFSKSIQGFTAEAGPYGSAQGAASASGATGTTPQPEYVSIPSADQATADDPVLVRPELFFTRNVVGLTIAESAVVNGRPTARWMTALRWRDGRRELVPPSAIQETTNGTIHFAASPSHPPTALIDTWSKSARQRWPDNAVVDAAATYRDLRGRIDHYLDFQDGNTVDVVSLWALLTYLYPAFPAVPYLYLGGPAGSGKSRVLEVLAEVCFRPLSSSNITAPALFRTLDERGGTLLLDEAENLRSSAGRELRSVLLAGYKLGGQVTRLESTPEGRRTVEFDVYGPKAMACIEGLPPALHSRCITISMLRSAPGSPKAARRVSSDAGWQALRDHLHALVVGPLGAAALDLTANADVCPFSSRAFELWQPILAIASLIEHGGEAGLLDRVKAYAARLLDENRDETNAAEDEQLLRALADLVQAGEKPGAAEILEAASKLEPSAFRNWTSTRVGVQLKKYGLHSTPGRKRRYLTRPEQLRSIADRYGMSLVDPPTAQASSVSSASSPEAGAAGTPDSHDDTDGTCDTSAGNANPPAAEHSPAPGRTGAPTPTDSGMAGTLTKRGPTRGKRKIRNGRHKNKKGSNSDASGKKKRRNPHPAGKRVQQRGARRRRPRS